MVRTEGVGFIRDPKRIVVAFSRARYGLYVVGKFTNFSNYFENKTMFNIFLNKGTPKSIFQVYS